MTYTLEDFARDRAVIEVREDMDDSSFYIEAAGRWPLALDALEAAWARIARLEAALRVYVDRGNWSDEGIKWLGALISTEHPGWAVAQEALK